jgi:hypothetical protein
MIDPETKVSEILKQKLGRIFHAPLDPGSPTWNELRMMTWGDIEARAREGKPGYQAIHKLLTDRRFNR